MEKKVEDITLLLKQTTDLVTRLEERCETFKIRQVEIFKKIEELQRETSEMRSKINHLYTNDNLLKIDNNSSKIKDLTNEINDLKNKSTSSEDRWKQIGNFFIQLVWVVLAAYILTKVGLQAPAVP